MSWRAPRGEIEFGEQRRGRRWGGWSGAILWAWITVGVGFSTARIVATSLLLRFASFA